MKPEHYLSFSSVRNKKTKIEKAIELVLNYGFSENMASKIVGIPQSNLNDRMRKIKKNEKIGEYGRKPFLLIEEKVELERWIKELNEKQSCPDINLVKEKVFFFCIFEFF